MGDESRDNEALVAFLKALAVTIISMDGRELKLRSSEDFIRELDGLLEDLPNHPEIDGSFLHQRVQVLRKNLDVALGKARLAQMPVEGSG